MFVFATIGSWAQTAGNLNFTINPVAHNGSYGAKHVVAVWLENETGTFIKTKLKQASSSTIDHLATWTSKSNSNVVDATSGATLTSYTPLTAIWNGTNVSGTVVPDGVYKIWIEMAWDDSKTTAKTVTSYSFTKGTVASTVKPANTSLFTDVSLVWTPLSTGVKEIPRSNNLNVFPNPTSGIVNIDLKSFQAVSKIQLLNTNGQVLFEKFISGATSGVKSFDLSKYPKGIYLINIVSGKKSVGQSKVVLEK